MFVDKVKIKFIAGSGGNGIVSWRREKFVPKGGPFGGNGGKGGCICFKTDTGAYSLEAFRHSKIIKAENGKPGGSGLKQGRSGKDLIVTIPCGTQAKDPVTGEMLFDFTQENKTWVICQGGRGGKGNACFKSPTNQAPNICTLGALGEEKEIELELKLIADVGLIGMPNAGKSTLMSAITHVKVKIGAYPFTTLIPNLSYVECEDFSRILVADIPGIIEDAHLNKGLGLAFLRHIERTKALVFVIDISGEEREDPYHDFHILQRELKAYDPSILEKPFFVVLNKIDKEGSGKKAALFKKHYPFSKETLFEISALERKNLHLLIEEMRRLIAPTHIFASI